MTTTDKDDAVPVKLLCQEELDLLEKIMGKKAFYNSKGCTTSTPKLLKFIIAYGLRQRNKAREEAISIIEYMKQDLGAPNTKGDYQRGIHALIEKETP